MGQPRKYTPEQFKRKVDAYREHCEAAGKPIHISGFCLYADISRESYYNYRGYDGIGEEVGCKAIYLDSIKRLELASEDFAVGALFGGKSPVGAIFYLKNAHGWRDQQDITQHIVAEYLPPAELASELERAQRTIAQHEQQRAITADVDPV